MSLRPVFARGALALTRVGGEVATYQQRQGGPAFTVRAVPSQPENTDAAGFMRTGRASVSARFMIAAADIAPSRPEKGDLIAFGGEKGWKVETVDQDPTEAFYTLGLSRQD